MSRAAVTVHPDVVTLLLAALSGALVTVAGAALLVWLGWI